MIKTALKTKLAGYGFQLTLAIIAAMFLIVGAQAWRLHTAKTEISEVKRELATEKAEVAAVALEAEREARRVEAIHRAAMMALRTRLIEDRKNVEAERDHLIERVASGELRQRFTCPTASGGLPGTGGSTAGSDGAEDSGLSRADAEFLIRIAAEADDIAGQLAACQEVILIDRSR